MGIKPEDKVGWRREYEKVSENLKAPSAHGNLNTMTRYLGSIVELVKAKEQAIKAIEGG